MFPFLIYLHKMKLKYCYNAATYRDMRSGVAMFGPNMKNISPATKAGDAPLLQLRSHFFLMDHGGGGGRVQRFNYSSHYKPLQHVSDRHSVASHKTTTINASINHVSVRLLEPDILGGWTHLCKERIPLTVSRSRGRGERFRVGHGVCLPQRTPTQ